MDTIRNKSSLYIVATPIGNMQDITYRAVDTLKQVAYIVCEDTRHSGKLLKKLNIQKPLISLHSHNELNASNNIIQKIKEGYSIALVSDAGTPLISDPGQILIDLAHKNDIKVIPIPGASALTCAISALGTSSSFIFHGFLPTKQQKREFLLTSMSDFVGTHVIYEAPHRMEKTLNSIVDIFGEDFNIGIARELTKIYEEIRWVKVSEYIKEKESNFLGEYVLVLPVKDIDDFDHKENAYELLRALLKRDNSVKDSVKVASKYLSNAQKSNLYKMALEIHSEYFE